MGIVTYGVSPLAQLCSSPGGNLGRFWVESAAWRLEISATPYFSNALFERRTYFRTSLLMIVFMISLVPP